MSLLAIDPLNATAQTNFSVTFVNYPPQVVNPPATQVVGVNSAFDFILTADKIFSDPDGDTLSYSAQLLDGSPLPSWMHFDASQPNQLVFSGTAPSAGGTQVSLLAKDPLNANVSTEFEVLATNTTVVNSGTSPAQIAGGVVGGVLGLAAAIGTGLGFWRYSRNKNSRDGEQFADFIRIALNLKGVDNFDFGTGQEFVSFVYNLQSALREQGLDIGSMRRLERQQLADDVADAARNKISSATDCLGRSVISVTDLNDNLQRLVTEVQVLRASGAQIAKPRH